MTQMNSNAGYSPALRLFLLALLIWAGVAWWLVKVAHWDTLEACMTSAIGLSGFCFLYVLIAMLRDPDSL